jgi:hypothetical protein
MLAFVKRRRLRHGLNFEQFEEGWRAEKGYPVKNRVLNATRNDDLDEVVTVGFMDMPKMFASMALKKGAEQDSVETDRHDRVDEVTGETLMSAQYQAVAEYDFTAGPRSIKPGSKGSILHFKHAEPSAAGTKARPMLAAITVRQLREGTDLRALAAARSAGELRAPGCRLLDLRNLDNDRDILTIAFLGDADGEYADRIGALDADVATLTEGIAWSGLYTFRSEHDFKKVPVDVPVGSSQSILNF